MRGLKLCKLITRVHTIQMRVLHDVMYLCPTPFSQIIVRSMVRYHAYFRLYTGIPLGLYARWQEKVAYCHTL